MLVFFWLEDETNNRFAKVEVVFAKHHHSSISPLHRDHYYVKHQIMDSVDPKEFR